MGRGAAHNPYSPGMGTPPPYLAGRDRELAYFDELLAQLSAGGTQQHLILTGLRGVGKTVLLNELESRCERAGWPSEVYELERGARVGAIVAKACHQALLRLSATARAKDALGRAMQVLKSFTLTIGELSIGIDASAMPGRADSGDLPDDIRDLLVAVGEAARGGETGFALILDELQHLDARGLEALVVGLHRTNQKGLPVALVGAGLPLLPELIGGAKSYAERGFEFRRIGALARVDAREALIQPSAAQRVSWEDDALDLVVALTGGYPYFLQEYGREIWRLGGEDVITLEQVQSSVPIVRNRLDENFFSQRIGKLPRLERRYMAAIADLGDGAQSSSAVARHLGRDPKALSPTRARLAEAALIYVPRRGYVDFTVPLCADYLRRRHPLSE